MAASSHPPVLLTSSVVVHDTGVALRDTDERLRLTLESVGEWLRVDPELQLVICDGSGFDFSESVRQRYPSAKVECLFFQNDPEAVRLLGRGYGEGEIVRYAIEHSHLIAQAGCFAKCTAKLWVENYRDCLAEWDGRLCLKGVFLDAFSLFRPTTLAYIDTRFYIAEVRMYRELLLEAHSRVDKDQNYGLEEAFRDAVFATGLTGVLWRTPPVIEGVGGGIGVSYRNPFKRIIKEKLRSLLVQCHPKFTALFMPARA
ncbi:MAG: hypothetical protein ACK4F4_07070 [Hylemonella sp.]|uniref:hypothetical protein n=1 Tax=Hylemonella sp. TaxID=2066020 RepID=UPI003919926C